MRVLLITAFLAHSFAALAQIKISDTDMSNILEGKSFYEEQYDKSKHQNRLNKVKANSSYGNLADYFQFRKNDNVCETEIIQNLRTDFGDDLTEYALIQARKQNLIDDVVLDILLPLSKNLTKRQPESELIFTIRKGAEVLERKYSELFSSNTCLFDKYIELADYLEKQITDDDEHYMSFFNDWAKSKRVITRDQYKLLTTMAVEFQDTKSRLRLRDYLKKRKTILSKRKSIEKSDDITKREGKRTNYGKRYRLYKSYNLSEMDFLSNYITQMNRRILGEKAEIVFYTTDEANRDKEVISLGPTEQMRLALKLYTRDIRVLKNKELYRAKDLSFRTMLALGYEVGKINKEDIEYLYGIPSLWDRKISLGEKIAKVVNRYGFIVPIFTGPVGSYVYFLGLSIMNTMVKRKQDKLNSEGEFEHDLFYGNCDLGSF